MEYIIVRNDDEKKFLGKDNIGKYTVRTNIKQAIKFDTKEKAKNVINNSMSAFDRINWKVKENTEGQKSCIKIKSKTKINDNKIIEDIDWLFKVSEFETFNNDLLKQKSKLEEQQSRIDKELADTYHFIEDYSPPAHIRAKVYGVQQDILQKRRQIKKRLTYVNIMLGIFSENLSKGAIQDRIKNAYTCEEYKDRTGVYSKLQSMLIYKTE